jgi:hypothetical protein
LDHTCVDIRHRCDGIWDCVNGEDEMSCGAVICENKMDAFACKNRKCIDRGAYCDGVQDCTDGSDELYDCRCHVNGMYACAKKTAGDTEAQCVPRLKVCDGNDDCWDGSDEWHCGGRTVEAKEEEKEKEEIAIDDKEPINVINREVVGGSSVWSSEEEKEKEKEKEEEEKEKKEEEEQMEVIAETKRSSQKTKITTDRPLQSTESLTKNVETIKVSGGFQKAEGGAKVEDEDESTDFEYYDTIRPVIEPSLYDTSLSSANQIKETAQVNHEGDYRVRVYPESQWVYEGNDAVLQCRDEGDLRAAVAWKRNDGKNMSKRAVMDDWGRLSIAGMKMIDAGLYVCYVRGHEGRGSGSKMASQVTVRGSRSNWRQAP